MEQIAKNLTFKKTLRTIFRDKNVCIAEKIRIDGEKNILDRWISIRKVGRDGKVVTGKRGLISIASYSEPITMYGKTHSNKLLNFFILDNLNINYCSQVVEAEPGIFTIGKPELITNGNILLKSLNTPYQVEGQDLKYINQLPYDAGLVARCFVNLGSKKTFQIVNDAFYNIHGIDSKLVRFALTKQGLDDLSNHYENSKPRNKRNKGAVAKTIVNRENKAKEINVK